MHAFEPDVRLILPTGCAVDLTRFTLISSSFWWLMSHVLEESTYSLKRRPSVSSNFIELATPSDSSIDVRRMSSSNRLITHWPSLILGGLALARKSGRKTGCWFMKLRILLQLDRGAWGSRRGAFCYARYATRLLRHGCNDWTETRANLHPIVSRLHVYTARF